MKIKSRARSVRDLSSYNLPAAPNKGIFFNTVPISISVRTYQKIVKFKYFSRANSHFPALFKTQFSMTFQASPYLFVFNLYVPANNFSVMSG